MTDSKRFDNYIGGDWVAASAYSKNINPSDLSDVIGEYAQADVAQVQTAIDAARAAFPAWSTSGIQARSDALDKVGSEILARKEELGTLLAREEGKTLPEAIGEVSRAGNIFKFLPVNACACRVITCHRCALACMWKSPGKPWAWSV